MKIMGRIQQVSRLSVIWASRGKRSPKNAISGSFAAARDRHFHCCKQSAQHRCRLYLMYIPLKCPENNDANILAQGRDWAVWLLKS